MPHPRGGYTPIGEEEENAVTSNYEEGYAIRPEPEVLASSGFAPSTEGQLRWDHIQNLDEFFTLVYEYHQRHGFLCILLDAVWTLVQFIFVVLFAVFLTSCVNYQILFATPKSGMKTHLSDAVIPPGQCAARLNPVVICSIVIAVLFWMVLLIRGSYRVSRHWEIRNFYRTALNISSEDLVNMTWHDVLVKLLEVQREMQLCVHKNELNELDVYNRILRFKNYQIAMINKGVLPVKLHVPYIGEVVYLTNGYLFNIDFLLFFGPWALFENYWHVKVVVKHRENRQQLSEELRGRILKLGILNLVLAPFILLWQLFYSFFKYTELLKREPGRFGLRRWSHFGRLFLRHFNELEHEFKSRLNRAHSSATKYMSIFSSRLVVIMASNVMFISGALLAVLILLSVMDEDVLRVDHVVTAIAALTLVVTICRAMVPDENLVWCPETLLLRTLADIHYMPDHWKGQAHTNQVREEFSQLFQFQLIHVVEELLSPLITPLVLIFYLRPNAERMIDFMRNFTVEVPGVGDICSFAQLNLRKHGHPMWLPEAHTTEAGLCERTEHGKVELSLMHFHLTNPQWQPPSTSRQYLDAVRQQVQRDTSAAVGEFGGPGASLALASIFSVSESGQGLLPDRGSILATTQRSLLQSLHHNTDRLMGGVSGLTGPTQDYGPGVMSAMQESMIGGGLGPDDRSTLGFEGGAVELMAMNMNMSTLYMHELHHRRRQQQQYRNTAVRLDSPTLDSPQEAPSSPMPSLAQLGQPPVLGLRPPEDIIT